MQAIKQRRGSRYSFITMSSTSVLASWSPLGIFNVGDTLDWTVSGGVVISKTTVNDPTFDFSGNTGTANILVEKVDGLITLSIPNLSLTILDVSMNTELIVLNCKNNTISALDVSMNTALEQLYCNNNTISALDVSMNTELTELWCFGNNQAPSITDQVFIDLDTNGVLNGYLDIRNNRTSASDTARSNLITKGWTITDTYTS